MFRTLLSGVLSLIIPGPVHFPTEVMDVLQDLKVPYEIVSQIDDNDTEVGFYRFRDGMILIDDSVASSTFKLAYVVSHEMIHKVRYENGLWTGDALFEEQVAILGADRMGRLLGLPHTKTDLKKCLESNGIRMEDVDKVRVEKELEKTFEFIGTQH